MNQQSKIQELKSKIKHAAFLVVFTLDNQKFAFLLPFVERVVPVVEITRFPKAPETVMGVVNICGRIIPVINIRKRFRLPLKEINLSDKLVLAQTSKRPVAIIVDTVVGVLKLSDKDLILAEEIVPGFEYVEGVIKSGDDMILIHDLDKFLSLEEEKALDKVLGKT